MTRLEGRRGGPNRTSKSVFEIFEGYDVEDLVLFKSLVSESESLANSVRLGGGKGIVTCAGGEVLQMNCWGMIKSLKRMGCELPIQVWYDSRVEGDDVFHSMLKGVGCRVVDASSLGFDREPNKEMPIFLSKYKYNPRWAYGYMMKVFALMNCKFDEVIFLDADNYPLRNPTFLFDDVSYKTHGAIFWPDCLYSIYGPFIKPFVPDFDISSIGWGKGLESGQIVLNKRVCSRALALTYLLNLYSDRTYCYLWGDKDTFLASWLMLGLHVNTAPKPPIINDPVFFRIIQLGPDGEQLFWHRCGTNKSKDLDFLDRSTFPFDFNIDDLNEYKELRQSDPFTLIYKNGGFDSNISSGSGSYVDFTEEYRKLLENFIRINGIKSVFDYGCGDWNFSRLVDWGGASYLGVDCVSSVIKENERKYKRPGVNFECWSWNTSHEFPKCDLLIVKDVMQHWCIDRIKRFLSWIGDFKFAFFINDLAEENVDIQDGGHRGIDLGKPPFNVRGVYMYNFPPGPGFQKVLYLVDGSSRWRG